MKKLLLVLLCVPLIGIGQYEPKRGSQERKDISNAIRDSLGHEYIFKYNELSVDKNTSIAFANVNLIYKDSKKYKINDWGDRDSNIVILAKDSSLNWYVLTCEGHDNEQQIQIANKYEEIGSKYLVDGNYKLAIQAYSTALYFAGLEDIQSEIEANSEQLWIKLDVSCGIAYAYYLAGDLMSACLLWEFYTCEGVRELLGEDVDNRINLICNQKQKIIDTVFVYSLQNACVFACVELESVSKVDINGESLIHRFEYCQIKECKVDAEEFFDGGDSTFIITYYFDTLTCEEEFVDIYIWCQICDNDDMEFLNESTAKCSNCNKLYLREERKIEFVTEFEKILINVEGLE